MAASKRKQIVTKPELLILREKHGEGYYLINNDKKLFEVSLVILKTRFNEGWYYDPDESEIPKASLTKEQIEALPEGHVKQVAVREMNSIKREIRLYKESMKSYKNIKKAIKDSDGRMAYMCLMDRRDGEYEGFELIDFNTI